MIIIKPLLWAHQTNKITPSSTWESGNIMYNRQTIFKHGIIFWHENPKSSSGRGSTGIILKQERGRTEKSLYHFSFYLFYDKLFLFLFVTITHWFPLHKTNQAVCHRTKLLIWKQFTTRMVQKEASGCCLP